MWQPQIAHQTTPPVRQRRWPLLTAWRPKLSKTNLLAPLPSQACSAKAAIDDGFETTLWQTAHCSPARICSTWCLNEAGLARLARGTSAGRLGATSASLNTPAKAAALAKLSM